MSFDLTLNWAMAVVYLQTRCTICILYWRLRWIVGVNWCQTVSWPWFIYYSIVPRNSKSECNFRFCPSRRLMVTLSPHRISVGIACLLLQAYRITYTYIKTYNVYIVIAKLVRRLFWDQFFFPFAKKTSCRIRDARGGGLHIVAIPRDAC